MPQYNAQLTDWMRRAQSVGVTRGVWVQPSFLGTDNRLMIDALKSHPDKLRGIAVVRPDASVDDLKNLNGFCVRGIRLNLSGVSHEIPEWTRADSLWEAIHALNWHLEVHIDQGKLPHVLSQLPSDVTLVSTTWPSPWKPARLPRLCLRSKSTQGLYRCA